MLAFLFSAVMNKVITFKRMTLKSYYAGFKKGQFFPKLANFQKKMPVLFQSLPISNKNVNFIPKLLQ